MEDKDYSLAGNGLSAKVGNGDSKSFHYEEETGSRPVSVFFFEVLLMSDKKNSKATVAKKLTVKEKIKKISSMTEEQLVMTRFRTMKILNAAQDKLETYDSALKQWEIENFPTIDSTKSNRKVAGLLLGAVSEAMKRFTKSPDKVKQDDVVDESGDFAFL